MVKLGERFFTSLGFDPLPQTFWERSLFVRPRDREVVCHASAWDVTWSDDLRIKMCIEPTEEDLITIHHELGHDYYFHAYSKLPILFQQGANDGFHEAIGDTIALSVTPEYLKGLGLLDAVPKGDKGAHQRADEDGARQGRVPAVRPPHRQVAVGRASPARRPRRLQRGVVGAPREVPGRRAARRAHARTTSIPGAKYHVRVEHAVRRATSSRASTSSSSTARSVKAAGYTGPLDQCSIYGDARRGRSSRAMLALGASKPWPEALEALGAGRRADARRPARVLRAAPALARGAGQGARLRVALSPCYLHGSEIAARRDAQHLEPLRPVGPAARRRSAPASPR